MTTATTILVVASVLAATSASIVLLIQLYRSHKETEAYLDNIGKDLSDIVIRIRECHKDPELSKEERTSLCVAERGLSDTLTKVEKHYKNLGLGHRRRDKNRAKRRQYDCECSRFDTTQRFWDCECETDYIRPKSQYRCNICGYTEEEMPDSRVTEVLNKYPHLSTNDLKPLN